MTGHPIPAVVTGPRAGDPPALVADAGLARRELGWEPQYTTIGPIIETAWRWHKAHPHGYEDRGADPDRRRVMLARRHGVCLSDIGELICERGPDRRGGVTAAKSRRRRPRRTWKEAGGKEPDVEIIACPRRVEEGELEETLDSQTVALRWIAGLLIAGAAWLLAPILVPFVLGLVLSIALSPLAGRLERLGLGRTGSSLFCLVLVAAILAATAGLLAFQAGTIVQQSDRYLDRLGGMLVGHDEGRRAAITC